MNPDKLANNETFDCIKQSILSSKGTHNFYNKKSKGQRKRNKKLQKRKNKQKQLRKLVPKKYSEYIKSNFWTQRKREYYKTHKKECSVCKTTKNINLHHTSYRHVGFEKDNELLPLCDMHHEKYHNLFGVGLDNPMTPDIASMIREEENTQNFFRNIR